jgi:haloalkane dehalogenase
MPTTPLPKQYATVNGLRMAFHERGEGDAIVFLHGNPTSSYLWRDVISHVERLGRCVAPDLIGHGDSDKLPDSGPNRYRLTEHRRYLDDLLEQLDIGDSVTFVIHDWGSALGFDWAFRHPDRIKGLCYMEAFVQPLTWDVWPEIARDIFQGYRSDAGEALTLDMNTFVEGVLPSAIMRQLADEEMAEYRRPFTEPGEARRPTLSWPREIPIDGEPADVVTLVSNYSRWLSSSEIPKLFVNADPGAILTGPQREFCRTWPNQSEVTVPGIHFIQEDSAEEIGTALAEWYRRI